MVLVDRIGVLFEIYSVGDLIFCGGTFEPVGGHNILEPAAWSKAVFYGPHLKKVLHEHRILRNFGGSFLAAGPEDLFSQWKKWLGDLAGLRKNGEAANKALHSLKGVVDRQVELILGSPIEGRSDMRKIEEILQEFKDGGASMGEVLEYLEKLPFEDLCFAKVDHHRCLRRGFAEVIYGEGKTAAQIAEIAQSMIRFGSNVLVTRVDKEKAEAVMAIIGEIKYHPQAGAMTFRQEAEPGPVPEGPVQVICAGSSDIPVAEEAALTAEFMGNRVQRHYDMGVAGIHRLLGAWESLRKGCVHVVVAGMEGALPSVVAGW